MSKKTKNTKNSTKQSIQCLLGWIAANPVIKKEKQKEIVNKHVKI